MHNADDPSTYTACADISKPIVRWEAFWDFGDNTGTEPVTDPEPRVDFTTSHVYQNPENEDFVTYDVTLTVQGFDDGKLLPTLYETHYGADLNSNGSISRGLIRDQTSESGHAVDLNGDGDVTHTGVAGPFDETTLGFDLDGDGLASTSAVAGPLDEAGPYGVDLDGDGDTTSTALASGFYEGLYNADLDDNNGIEVAAILDPVNEFGHSVDLNADGDVSDSSVAGPFDETTLGFDLDGDGLVSNPAVAGPLNEPGSYGVDLDGDGIIAVENLTAVGNNANLFFIEDDPDLARPVQVTVESVDRVAQLLLVPGVERAGPSFIFDADLLVNPNGQKLDVVDAFLDFPADLLQVVSIQPDLINFEGVEPFVSSFDNQSGTVDLSNYTLPDPSPTDAPFRIATIKPGFPRSNQLSWI